MLRILMILLLMAGLPAITQTPVFEITNKADTGHYTAGQAAFLEGRFDEAVEQNERYLDEAVQKKDVGRIFQNLTGMFSIYHRKGDYDKSFYFAQQLYEIAEKSGDTNRLATSLWCLAQSYSLGNDYANALAYYRHAWSISGTAIKKDSISRETSKRFLLEFAETFSQLQQRDSAAYYYRIAQSANNEEQTLYWISIGETQYRQGDFRQALHSYSIAFMDQHITKNERTRLLLDLSSAQLALGDNFAALQYARGSLELAFALHVNHYIRDGYQLLSEAFSRLDLMDSSDRYFKKYSIIKEGIFNEQVRSKFAAWQFEQKLARIQKEKQALLRQQRLEMMLLLTGVISLGGILLAWSRIIQLKKRSAMLRKNNELEIMALRARMNPHFIFNCLNSINQFIIGHEVKKGADYLTKFARLMRIILERSAEAYTVLQDELDALQLYIDLERLRIEKTFSYEIDIGSIDSSAVMIPSLLIQPFVENAIWHGLQPSKEGPGKIDIQFRQEANWLRCEIRDNGIGINSSQKAIVKFAVEKKDSMGIELTSRRLQVANSFSNENEAVQIHDLQNENGSKGTLVILLLPFKII